MKMKGIRLMGLLVGLAVVALATNVHYVFSAAGNLPGALQTYAEADSLTQVAGYYISSSTQSGYLETAPSMKGGKPTFLTLMPPSAWISYANGVNSQGVAVGGYCVPPQGCGYPQSQHGFSYSNGVYTTIDYPGMNTTAVYGINDLGQIVGGFCPIGPVCGGDFNSTDHGFIDNNGNFTQLDYPGGGGTQANAINSTGVVVGIYSTSSGIHSYIYQNGVYTNIDYPGEVYTEPYTINDKGIVGGLYQDGQLRIHGFLYRNGKFTTVDHPNTTSTAITGINDDDIIVGIWENPQVLPFKGIPIR
jgi:uncharacterized membrane protein